MKFWRIPNVIEAYNQNTIKGLLNPRKPPLHLSIFSYILAKIFCGVRVSGEHKVIHQHVYDTKPLLGFGGGGGGA